MIEICIVIQSEAFLVSAGMRIRYKRLIGAASAEARFTTVTIAELATRMHFEADIYIFCKVFSTEAVVLAAHLRRLGKTVGQDIFDDYFSQMEDSRLARYRRWLQEVAAYTHFATCTTAAMADTLASYLPGRPITILGDPVESYDPEKLEKLVTAKLEEARESRRLSVLWFGIGDNPFFSVGLRDLGAHGAELARFKRLGWEVDLRVLTNVRALSAEGLRNLRELPLPCRTEEWSEGLEAEALRESTVVFLPVSGQSFSRAKSLNRCVTSLLQGCQVLSRGFPLYEVLSSFIYRTADDLASDLSRAAPKLRASTIPSLVDRLSAVADPVGGATALVNAARSARASRHASQRAASGQWAVGQPQFCVLHGLDSSAAVHKLAGRLRGVSIRSPFHHGRLNYPVRFDVADGQLQVLVERSRARSLPAYIAATATDFGKILDHEFCRIPLEVLGLDKSQPVNAILDGDIPAKLAVYPNVMSCLASTCQKLFPSADVIVSENHHLALCCRGGSFCSQSVAVGDDGRSGR